MFMVNVGKYTIHGSYRYPMKAHPVLLLNHVESIVGVFVESCWIYLFLIILNLISFFETIAKHVESNVSKQITQELTTTYTSWQNLTWNPTMEVDGSDAFPFSIGFNLQVTQPFIFQLCFYVSPVDQSVSGSGPPGTAWSLCQESLSKCTLQRHDRYNEGCLPCREIWKWTDMKKTTSINAGFNSMTYRIFIYIYGSFSQTSSILNGCLRFQTAKKNSNINVFHENIYIKQSEKSPLQIMVYIP